MHLQVDIISLPQLRSRHIISLPFSRREIDGYKVPSKDTTDFLQVLYGNRESASSHSFGVCWLPFWVLALQNLVTLLHWK
jgi:hypothetical protein